MKIAAVAEHEGGLWVVASVYHRMVRSQHSDGRVHAIMFEDGSVWDAYNGMRDSNHSELIASWAEAEEAKTKLVACINETPDKTRVEELEALLREDDTPVTITPDGRVVPARATKRPRFCGDYGVLLLRS